MGRRSSPKLVTAAKCGHSTKTKGGVTAFGVTITTEMPIKHGHVDYCLICIADMAIQCAWCELPIFIGDPVTLYTPKAGFEIPDHAMVFSEEPLRLVGCLRWDCASTGADRAGFWVPDAEGHGHVQQATSLYDMAQQSGDGVAVNDLSDPTVTPHRIPHST